MHPKNKKQHDSKQFYIQKLLAAGIYKAKNKQLYELTMNQLKNLYKNIFMNKGY